MPDVGWIIVAAGWLFALPLIPAKPGMPEPRSIALNEPFSWLQSPPYPTNLLPLGQAIGAGFPRNMLYLQGDERVWPYVQST